MASSDRIVGMVRVGNTVLAPFRGRDGPWHQPARTCFLHHARDRVDLATLIRRKTERFRMRPAAGIWRVRRHMIPCTVGKRPSAFPGGMAPGGPEMIQIR